MRWFRFYDEVLDDPKVQKLPPPLFRRWVNLLCLANRGQPRGVLPGLAGIAFALRISTADAEGTISALKQADLLDDKEGRLMPHNWKKRQPESDDSLPRVQRYRHGEGAVTETPPEERRGDTEEIQRRSVTVGDSGFVVPGGLLTLWKETYPAVDVPRVVREAYAWTVANPANRKSNWARFLTSWLKREQDRAPRVPTPPPPPPRPAILDEPELPIEERAANLRRVGEMAGEVARRRAMP